MTVTSNYKIPKLFGKPLLPLLSAWLFTFIGGYASAYAYVVLDGVFANMQTGNIIKCVIFAMEGKEFLYLLYSILSFVLGVVTAVVLGKFDRGNIITLTIEMFFIAISCVFAVGGDNNKLFVNLLVSFSCALQYEFFRVVGESGFTSVMCTNNMRLAVRNFTSGVIERDKKKIGEGVYFLSFMLLFVVGVAVGTVVSCQIEYFAVVYCEIPLFVIFVLQIAQDKLQKNQ